LDNQNKAQQEARRHFPMSDGDQRRGGNKRERGQSGSQELHDCDPLATNGQSDEGQRHSDLDDLRHKEQAQECERQQGQPPQRFIGRYSGDQLGLSSLRQPSLTNIRRKRCSNCHCNSNDEQEGMGTLTNTSTRGKGLTVTADVPVCRFGTSLAEEVRRDFEYRTGEEVALWTRSVVGPGLVRLSLV
jgi:hypothetical protein